MKSRGMGVGGKMRLAGITIKECTGHQVLDHTDRRGRLRFQPALPRISIDRINTGYMVPIQHVTPRPTSTEANTVSFLGLVRVTLASVSVTSRRACRKTPLGRVWTACSGRNKKRFTGELELSLHFSLMTRARKAVLVGLMLHPEAPASKARTTWMVA